MSSLVGREGGRGEGEGGRERDELVSREGGREVSSLVGREGGR